MTYAIPLTILGALILLAMCARAILRCRVTDRNEIAAASISIMGTAHEQKGN